MSGNEYVADVEHLTQLLRVFDAEAQRGRDPFEFVGTMLWHDRETVEIKGVRVEKWTAFVAMRGAIAKALASQGASRVFWVRKNHGKERVVSMSVSRYLKPVEPSNKLRIQSLMARLNRPMKLVN